MYLHDNVINWDDSAVKEAFDNAKSRFWAEINGLPCDITLPDPNIYIDNIDWNSSVDPELFLDLERDAKVPNEEERDEEVVILGSSLLLNQTFSCTGWGDDEEGIPKPSSPNYATQGWESNLHENNGVNSWDQYCAPVDPAKEYEWQISQGWNQREHYGGDLHNKVKGRTGGNGNWGTTWDGYNRKRENMSWSNKTPSGYHGNEYQMNRGRRNNRGGRRGSFAYDRPYLERVPTPSAW
ncbi:hypothetical protein SESBI_26748 [Sesbania bispinosa]|nr:hypothetical protein SESBI_26748 [Sesbania bispinosa]